MSRWREVADGVFQARYEPWDVNVFVVRGGDELLLVDTRASARQGDEVRADCQVFGPARLRAVVNTHAHFDHTFGNSRFGPGSDLDLPIYGHVGVPEHLERYEVPMLAAWVEGGEEPVEEWREVVITPPSRLVGEHSELDVGGRLVELVHLGRGHTDNDLLLHVPDAAAWLAGDVVEESGPPMYGTGCFPLEWPGTVERLVGVLGADDVVLPGHGLPVDRAFVAAQARELAGVADVLRSLHAAGVAAGEAVTAGADRWPFPVEGLEKGVDQAWAALDAVSRSASS